MKRKSHKFLWLFVIIIVFIVVSLVALGHSKKNKPLEVEVGLVSHRDLTELVVANGKIQPVTYVKISSEVSGEIIDLPVKEGQKVKKGDLLMRVKPDLYIASSNSAVASLQSSLGERDIALSSLNKCQQEWNRGKGLFESKLLSQADYDVLQDAYLAAQSRYTNSLHGITISQSALDRAREDLEKCWVYSPLNGIVSKLNSEKGEKVVGTGTYTGTEVMTISDLDEMEARVDIAEMDINLIAIGQKANLEVDAFKDEKFTGTVTQIANTASSTTSTEATKFEVRILIAEKAPFRPGMSVTAEVETRYRTNVLAVPMQCVTTRVEGDLKDKQKKNFLGMEMDDNRTALEKKLDKNIVPQEVVFVVEADHVVKKPVKRGISDDNYTEIIEGLEEGEMVVTGGYKTISKDLQDKMKVLCK